MLGPTYDNKILDALLGDDKGPEMPANVWVALFTTNPDKVGATEGVEPSGGAYERIEVANTTAEWPDAVSGQKINANELSFPEPTDNWGTVVGWGIFDHATNTALANLITAGTFSVSYGVNTGSDPKIPAEAIIIEVV